VHHHVGAAHARQQRLGTAHVAVDDLDLAPPAPDDAIGLLVGGGVAQRPHRVAGLDERIDDVGADVAEGAGDEDAHSRGASSFAWR
jgi:hypothetical protein